MNGIDFTKLCRSEEIHGEDEQETKELIALFEEAKRFISKFKWCGGIKESYFGFGIGGIVGVFLFRIEPQLIGVDEWSWVIVGDLPPAYIVTDASPDPGAALGAYVFEMRKWVDAVKLGAEVKHLIPVNTPATKQYAEMLENRLASLEEDIIPLCSDETE